MTEPMQNLGKIVMTCEGQWINRRYDKLCLVYDKYYASYISKRPVPMGVPLEDEHYWQPVAQLDKILSADYEGFKKKMIEFVAWAQTKIAGTRIVVETDEERESLVLPNVMPGCEVYVNETGLSWILLSIDTLGNKTWKLADAKIDGHPVAKTYIDGEIFVADRAVADAEGRNIVDTYVTYDSIKTYMEDVAKDYFANYQFVLEDNQVSWDNLSDSLKKLFTEKTHIVNFPDDEDLMVTKENTLKFKDRDFHKKSYDGLGYHIVRKHFADHINLLDQQNICKDMTIYEIRYDFDLNGDKIVLPNHSVLYFNGGTLKNGMIELNDTMILGIAKLSDAFTDIEFSGTFHTGLILFSDTGNVPAYWDGTEWKYLSSKDYTDKEIEDLKNYIDELINNINTRLTNIDTALTNMKTAISNLGTAYDALATRVTNLETTVNTLKSDLEALTTRVTNLETTVASLQTALNNLTTRVTNLEDLYAKLKAQLDELAKNIGNTTNYNFDPDITINNIPSDAKYVTINMSADGEFGIDGTMNDGAETHIIIHNTSTGSINVSIDSDKFTVTDAVNPVTISGGAWGEINVVMISGVMYVRSGC